MVGKKGLNSCEDVLTESLIVFKKKNPKRFNSYMKQNFSGHIIFIDKFINKTSLRYTRMLLGR